VGKRQEIFYQGPCTVRDSDPMARGLLRERFGADFLVTTALRATELRFGVRRRLCRCASVGKAWKATPQVLVCHRQFRPEAYPRLATTGLHGCLNSGLTEDERVQARPRRTARARDAAPGGRLFTIR